MIYTDTFAGQLQAQFESKRDEVERRKQMEKQSLYQTLFERDMEAHLATANTASKRHDDKRLTEAFVPEPTSMHLSNMAMAHVIIVCSKFAHAPFKLG